eukprot:COSAG01_NODE_49661_length_370_cov_0.841328_1_plen_20_part_10
MVAQVTSEVENFISSHVPHM